MFAIIKTEFQKMKRYHILLIGMIGMLCSPLLQLFSQAVMTQEAKRSVFDFAALIEVTLWGNAQVFMPVIFTLIGGYLINREYTDDTLKNILTVPLSFRKFLTGKLVFIGLLAMLFGIYCFVVTVIAGLLAGLPGLTAGTALKGLIQMTGLSFFLYLAVLPIIALCSQRPGAFMGGSVIAFLSGYCVLFFKSGILRQIYPFSAALTMIGFDSSSFSGTSDQGSIPLALLSLGAMLILAALPVLLSGKPKDTHRTKAHRNRGIALRAAQRKKTAAHRL